MRRVASTGAVILLIVASTSAVAAEESEAVARRRRAVAELATSKSPKVAESLHRVVIRDRSLDVRVDAAASLGAIDSKLAMPALVDLATRGNAARVRRAIAESLSRRVDAINALEEAYANDKTELTERLLLVETAVELPGAESFLGRLVTSAQPVVAAAALRELMRIEDRAIVAGYAEMALQDTSAPDLTIAALDALATAELGELEPLEEKLGELAASEERSISIRAAFLVKRIEYLREMSERDAVRSTRYAIPGSDPDAPQPSVLSPVDLVLSFDATHSERGERIERVRRRLRDEVDRARLRGADLRVAVVAYRDLLRDQNQRQTGWTLRVYPFTYDIDGALRWMDEIEAGGVGNQGGAVEQAIAETCTRLVFRERARRRLVLVIAARIPKLDSCIALTRAFVRTQSIEMKLLVRGRLDSDWLEPLARVAGCDIERL